MPIPIADDNIKKAVIDVLNNYGINVVAEIQDNIEHEGHVATGRLKDSVRFKVNVAGQICYFELYLADYWKYVEYGRKPGKMPPVNAILTWMGYKRIGSYITGKGKNPAVGKKSILATNLREQRSIAYLIARKIAKRGIKPTGFFSRAFNPNHSGDRMKLQKDLSSVLKTEVIVTIKQLKENESGTKE